MIKSQLIQRVAEQNPHLYERDVERVVNVILSRITDALASGGRVELRGLGSFTVRDQDARAGRNPKTGDQIAVDAKAKVVFRPSRVMAGRLNGSEGQEPSELEADAGRLLRSVSFNR